MNRILAVVALVCAAICFCSVAFADQGAAVAPPALTGWTGLALLCTTLAVYSVRRFAPSVHFFQTAGGAFVLMLIATILNALATGIQTSGLNLQVLESSVIGAVLSLLATANPTMSAENRDAAKKVSAFIPLIFIALAAPGCTFCQQAANAGTARCIAQEVAIDCGVTATEQAALDLLPAIEARINSQTVDWTAIGNLELTHDGLPAVACAIQMAEKLAGAGAAPSVPAKKIDAGLVADILKNRDQVMANAREYYAARRIRFKAAAKLAAMIPPGVWLAWVLPGFYARQQAAL